MTETVVVLGSGYAGSGAIQRLEDEVEGDIDLVWISERPYHLVLHEAHRCIRDPRVREHITIPVSEIKSPTTRFIEDRASSVDTESREIHLDDGRTVSYDYLLVAVGSQTAFFGIEGLEERALTLKNLEDALTINDAIETAAASSTPDEPAQVIIGGGGQTGVQVAGEIATYRDENDARIDVTLVEGLPSIVPNNDRDFQRAIRKRLAEHSIDVQTGHFVTSVDDFRIYFDEKGPIRYDVLIWTGGITGHREMSDVGVEIGKRSNRLETATTFQTDNERLFAVGDAALIDQPGDDPAPPTAQAAWQAAGVAATNIVRSIRGQPLIEWRFEDKGTVVSIGDEAVATDVIHSPISTFDGIAAMLLKRVIATRWIADIASIKRALSAWTHM